MPDSRRCSYNTYYPLYLRKYMNENGISRKASSCISDRKGSVTIEAALAVPLFFFAVLTLFYMIEVMAIRTNIRSGMQYAAKAAAEEAYSKPFVIPGGLESDLVNAVGAERLDRSIVVNGSSGIHCEKSRMSAVTGILDMKAEYQIQLPLPIFAAPPVKMEESLRVKGWNGYRNAGFSGEEDETVYITETGMVYHRDYHCNYLELSIQMVSADAVEELRNANQGKYHACEFCVHGNASGMVYITDYGERYHTSLGCSGLKRTIYAVPRSEAVGKGACSKCSR